jgi:RNA polymerase sigma-70 factor (ECF subfamily)
MSGRHDPEEARRRRFADVYDENYHLILGYALRRAPAGDAADLAAETFLLAWRRLDDVPPGAEARLWLYGAARRLLANQRRGERRRERLAERMRDDARTAADRDEVHEGHGLRAAFARLRADQRELLALVAWEGLEPREIACVVGSSPNAVRLRLHRARRRLAALLEEEGRGGVAPRRRDDARAGRVRMEEAR